MDKRINMTGLCKRMPYKAPDGVFDDIERNVLTATGCKNAASRRLRAICAALTAAASLTIIVMLSLHRDPEQTDPLAEVCLAFNELDNTDRAFLSEIYEEDTFININY